MRNVTIGLSSIILTALLFSSCTCQEALEQPAPQIPPERGGGFQTSEKKNTPAQHAQAATPTKAAEQVAGAQPSPTVAVQMPPDFPADVPVFKDAALSQVQNLANDARNVIFRTTATVDNVASFYQDTMTKGGWKVSQQFTRGNHAFMTFQKGEMLANVTIAEDVRHPGQQIIAIMYEHQKAVEGGDF